MGGWLVRAREVGGRMGERMGWASIAWILILRLSFGGDEVGEWWFGVNQDERVSRADYMGWDDRAYVSSARSVSRELGRRMRPTARRDCSPSETRLRCLTEHSD